jgi:flap endonuclease-1
MGIKNLTELIKKYSPESIRETTWEQLLSAGIVTRIAFDMPNLVYAYSSTSLKAIVEQCNDDALLKYAEEPDWVSLQGEVTRRLTDLILFVFMNIQVRGGKVVAVFDGKNIPTEKTLVTNVRYVSRDKMRAELITATEACKRDPLMVTPADFQRLRKAITSAMFFRKSEIYKYISRVLRHVGIPCVVSHGEGEKCASYLNGTGKVDAVYSVDMDTIAFGANVLISPLANNMIRIIDVREFLQKTQMTVEDVISIALVSGCDYTDGIKGIGPHKAFKGIVVDKTLVIPEEYEQYRRLFKHDPQIEKHVMLSNTSSLEHNSPDIQSHRVLISLMKSQ